MTCIRTKSQDSVRHNPPIDIGGAAQCPYGYWWHLLTGQQLYWYKTY